MSDAAADPSWNRWAGWAGLVAGLTAVVVLALLWLAGVFHAKVGEPAGAARPTPAAEAPAVAVRRVRVPLEESAAGTVKAVHETTLGSKILARVTEVRVKAGQRVAADEVLVQLDDADLRAREQQAQSAVAAARAARDQAKIEFDRIEALQQRQAASKIEFDRAATALKATTAELARAEQAANEATVQLAYATIRAPMTGVVVDRKVEVGDLVTPGTVLLTLYDPERMQMVASVREGLARRLATGQAVKVRLDALGYDCTAHISEIVPQAQAGSRTFDVKVTGPCPPGIYSGMFGRLLIPLEAQDVLVIPSAAVQRVGQLTLVDVIVNGRLQRRAVQLGRTFGDNCEVLAGLAEGEQVRLAAAPATQGAQP